MYLVTSHHWPLLHVSRSPPYCSPSSPTNNIPSADLFTTSEWGVLCDKTFITADWDKDPAAHKVYITVSVDTLWTPTSRVMLLQLVRWCVGPGREVNKGGRKEGGRMWITHTHAHAQTHTPVRCFPQLWVQSVSPRDSDRETLNATHPSFHFPHHIHTHTHTQTHTCTHFSLRFRDVTSGWVWSVSKGL